MEKNYDIIPSILSANFFNLEEDMSKLKKAKCSKIHLDVMDGHFVPNISFGVPIVKTLKYNTNMYLDVHLMISNPSKYIDMFIDAGADSLGIHVEIDENVYELIKMIKKRNVKFKLVVNPITSIKRVSKYLPKVDEVLLMSVNPGFGGQKFIKETYRKIEEIQKIKKEKNLNFKLQVDGGINLENKDKLIDLGVDDLIVGSSIFNGNIVENYINFKQKKN